MKEFKPTSWAIDNRTAIFIITVIITLVGIMSYNALPKEQFPDVVVPTIIVTTIYPGASPTDMEQLVTKPIEKQLKGINGVKKSNLVFHPGLLQYHRRIQYQPRRAAL